MHRSVSIAGADQLEYICLAHKHRTHEFTEEEKKMKRRKGGNKQMLSFHRERIIVNFSNDCSSYDTGFG